MGREANASREEILAACSAIAGEGRRPTVGEVRERLGGGSYSTISPIVKAWKEEAVQPASILDVPADALDLVRRCAAEIWTAADKAAGEKIKAVESAASERVQAVEEERVELLAEVSRLERELLEAREECRASAERVKALELEAARHSGVVDTLKERAKADSGRIAELMQRVDKEFDRAEVLERQKESWVQEREELRVSVKRLKDRLPRPPAAKGKKEENVKDNVA